MLNKILPLQASSPDELEIIIARLAEKEKLENSFVTLTLTSPKIVVRQFELPRLSLRELKNNLQLESAEFLSLPPEEVVFDYQILDSSVDRINGVFVALPQDTLEEYYLKITQAKMVPLSITVEILDVINAFLQRIDYTSSFCFVNFAMGNRIHLALFNAGHCELLREIPCENISDAGQEVLNSLRYAIGKSSVKHPEKIYCSGDCPDKDELISELENEFTIKGESVDLKGVEAQGQGRKDYFKINLIKEYAVSLPLRRNIHYILNSAIGVVLLFCLFALATIIKLDRMTKNLRREFDPSLKAAEYKSKINELQGEIKLLENGK